MKRHAAFTLIELLVVIAIIAILAAILFPVFAQAKMAAKKTKQLARADLVEAQLAEEALGDVGTQVATAAEGLDAAVGAAPGGLGDEELRHRGLGVDDLRVGAFVGQPRCVVGQQALTRGRHEARFAVGHQVRRWAHEAQRRVREARRH